MASDLHSDICLRTLCTEKQKNMCQNFQQGGLKSRNWSFVSLNLFVKNVRRAGREKEKEGVPLKKVMGVMRTEQKQTAMSEEERLRMNMLRMDLR